MKSWPILLAVMLLAFTTSTLGNFNADVLDKDENQVKTRSVDKDQDQEHGGDLYALNRKRRSMVNLMKRSWLGSLLNIGANLGLSIGMEKYPLMNMGEVKIIKVVKEDESSEKITASKKKKGSKNKDDDDDDDDDNKHNKHNRKGYNNIDDDDDDYFYDNDD